jgi:hypothetical protein
LSGWNFIGIAEKTSSNNVMIDSSSGCEFRKITGHKSEAKIFSEACRNEEIRKLGEGVIPSYFVKFVIQTQNLFARFLCQETLTNKLLGEHSQ